MPLRRVGYHGRALWRAETMMIEIIMTTGTMCTVGIRCERQ